MDAKIIVAAGAVAIFGIWLFKKKNDDENDTRRQNRESSNLDNADTSAAVMIKQALKWEKGLLSWSGDRITTNTPTKQALIYNACLDVIDWAAVQKKFSSLCNNEATILEALQSCCDDETYKNALQLCKAKKVVTTAPASATLYPDGSNEPQYLPFEANTNLGAYVATNGGNYSFINGFATDGSYWSPELLRTTGTIPTDKAKLV